MLKGIPSIISPELLKVLCEMGHGDEIILSDAHFPAYAAGVPVIHFSVRSGFCRRSNRAYEIIHENRRMGGFSFKGRDDERLE